MGISGDIRPRKPKRKIEAEPVAEPIIEDERPKLEDGEEEVLIHKHEAHIFDHFDNEPVAEDENPNDFFTDQTQNEQEPSSKISRPTKAKNNSRWLKIIITILVLLLVGILIKQNIKTIYKFIGVDELLGTSDVVTNTANPYESLSTDYTSSAKPSNEIDSSTTAPSSNNTAVTSPSTPPVAATNTLDKSSIKVSVLNGNGVKGSASSVKSALETAGYSVLNLSNAKVFTYQSTRIYHKSGKSNYASDIKKTLSSRTVEIEESNSIAGTYDIVVVVGAK